MHKIKTWVSTCLLFCLGAILLVLAVDLPFRNQPTNQMIVSSSLTRVNHRTARDPQWSVFEAIAGNSYEIFVADMTGKTWQLTSHFSNDRFPALSPDGRQVAFVSWRDGNSEIYVIDLDTGALRNLSNQAGRDALPAWSPDGTMLAYTSQRGEHNDIYLVDIGRGLTKNLTKSSHHDSQPIWSADGQQVIFTSDRDGARRQYALDFGGHHLAVYETENQWQTAQNTGMLEDTQGTIPG